MARAARQHPELLEALRRWELNLTGIRLLVPQLTRENVRDWIRAARHRSANEIRFTADPEFHAELMELQALMRHQIPDGDLALIRK